MGGVLKYAANSQENTHAEVWFQQICLANLLKSTLRHWCSLVFAACFQNTFFIRTPHERLFSNKSNFNDTWTHFMPLIYFDTPWKRRKTRGFLMFSRGIKRDSGMKWVNRRNNTSHSFLVNLEKYLIYW